MRVNPAGHFTVQGADIPDKYHHFFNAAIPPDANERRERRQSLAEKRLVNRMERQKEKKKAMYLRDRDGGGATRRQVLRNHKLE